MNTEYCYFVNVFTPLQTYPTLVSPEWLDENIKTPEVRLFDCTFFETETIDRARHLFDKEHIACSY